MVADPRPAGLNARRDAYMTGGHYGVVPWVSASGAVPAHPKNNNGPWSVADPRGGLAEPLAELPAPGDRLVAVIRALDGTELPHNDEINKRVIAASAEEVRRACGVELLRVMVTGDALTDGFLLSAALRDTDRAAASVAALHALN